MSNQHRQQFREQVFNRDNNQCLVLWCTKDADDAHHITERELWADGGYILPNGASVCNHHHQLAEDNYIPPQAFWRWIGNDPVTPEGMPENVNKWGDEFETPPWEDHRSRIKYPSSGHLPFSPEHENRRNDHTRIDYFADVPLVVTIKMDGSNAMVTRDRVAARNGSHADHRSFDYLKQMHSEFAHKIPEHIQIFGEWLYAKHSIHYVNGDCDCDDSGPPLDAYFQVFGVYDQRYNLWLSWPEVEKWAEKIGFPTTPVVTEGVFEDWELWNDHSSQEDLETLAKQVVDNGHEGIVVRTKFPFHYGQFEKRLGKYVRKNHVPDDADHWKTQEITRNEVADD